MNRMKVICQNIREAYPEQIKIGEVYFLDADNIFGDQEGWYAPVYDIDGNQIGSSLNLNHFRRIE